MVVLLLGLTMMLGTCSNYERVSAADDSSARAVNDTISLTIDGGTVDNSVTETVQGQTAYHSHSVQVSGKDIAAYTLTISGPTNLAGTSTISGAGGKFGYELAPNTWGYGWGDTSTTDANLAYQTLTTGGKSLDCGSVTNDNLECNKKLTFAARFGEDVATGNYTANVNLQLTATPRVVSSWSTMKYMQDMKAEYCDEPATPAKDATNVPTKTLIDRRDGKSYTVVKLHDGNCWMQENLRLGDTSEMFLKPSDTNIASNYTLPAGTNSGLWNASDPTVQQVRLGNTGLNSGWQTSWGNYYSWCAATAGACSETVAKNVNVSGSICPKGWHLPSGGDTSVTSGDVGTDSEFYKLTNELDRSAIKISPYLFSAAGRIYQSGGALIDANTDGYYWSRTSFSNVSAYYLYFGASGFRPGTGYGQRYLGYSVRCVADGASWKDTAGNEIEKTNLKTMQQVTKENFSDRYCANTPAANALVPVGSTITLQDSRDGNHYAIYKAADGNCWMGENLRLMNTTINSTNSDMTSGSFTIPASNKSGFTESDQSQPKAYYADSLKYGAYYNWYTTTVGTAVDTGDAPGSICPKGWKLPAYSGTGSFENLINSHVSNSGSGYLIGYNSTSALWLSAGRIYSSYFGDGGSRGFYWSRKAGGSSNAYHLYFWGGAGVAPHLSNGDRYEGDSVRCVAEP